MATPSAPRPLDPLVETYLHVNSARRGAPTTTPSNPIAVSLATPINSVVGVELLSATIPKTLYNITALNNLLTFTDGTGTFTITLPPGAYGATTLLTAIQSAMNAVSPGYTVAIGATTFKVTITYAGVGNITLSFDAARSIGPTLGYLPTSLTGAQTYTAPKVISLDQPYDWFVVCSQARASGSTTGTLTGFNWSIPMGGSISGDIVVWTTNEEYSSRVAISKTNLKALNFAICDDQGAALDLQGAEWSLLIRCYCEPTGRSRV